MLPGADADGTERRKLARVLAGAGRYDEAATVLEALGSDDDSLAALRLRARLN